MHTQVTNPARNQFLQRAKAVISATDRQLRALVRFEDEPVDTEPAGTGKKKPEKNYQVEHLEAHKNSESQPSSGGGLIFLIADVAIATTITPPSMIHASGVSAPRMRRRPKTSSTAETKIALMLANGIPAATKASRICSRRSGKKSLPRPERKNSRPTARRAMRAPSHCHSLNPVSRVRIQHNAML